MSAGSMSSVAGSAQCARSPAHRTARSANKLSGPKAILVHSQRQRGRDGGAPMPTRLIQRCQPESIREFRASAGQRYDDGLALAGTGNRTAAIYLWGYVAEMILKAAYFSLLGLAEHD